MVTRLPSWLFITLALPIMGFALMPIMRAALGIDDTIQISYLTTIMLLIGGLMCGLTGMLLLTRRQPDIQHKPNSNTTNENPKAALIHATGLLVFTGIPLANFLACYFFWVRYRQSSATLDTHGREAICQQLTFYLFLMMCLFMALLYVGVFALMLLLVLHFIVSVIATLQALRGKLFRYPANINIIDRNIDSTDNTNTTNKANTD